MAPASDRIIVVSRVGDGDIKTRQDHPAVVVLFGWLGAEDKHLQKYVDLYTSKNCSVVAAAGKNVDILLGNSAPLEKVARDAVKHVASIVRSLESKLGRNEKMAVVVHAFSNGGGFIVRALEDLLKRAKEGKDGMVDSDLLLVGDRLKSPGGALILDSAPAYMYPSKALKAIGVAVANPVLRLILRAVFMGYVQLSWLYSAVTQAETPPVAYWNKMINLTMTTKQAVVYSTADVITDPDRLAEYVEERRKKVDSLTVLKFEDSPHVLHLRHHPAEYGALVDKMIGISHSGGEK